MSEGGNEMVKTRRKGDYGSEELPREVRWEIQAALFREAIFIILVLAAALAFFLFTTVIAFATGDELSILRTGFYSEVLTRAIFKYLGLLFLDLAMIYYIIKFALRSVYFGQGRFTYRVAKVSEMKKIKNDEGANHYYVTCEDEVFGYPEQLGISYGEYKKTEVGGYVYVIYIDQSCKITNLRYVHHAKDMVD